MTTKLAHLARRTSLVALVAGLVLAGAGPASADVPEGWSNPAPVSPLHAILLLGGIPLLLFVVIALLVYAPSVVRSQRSGSGASVAQDEWFGGPRKGTAELAGPDSEESKAGGAGVRW